MGTPKKVMRHDTSWQDRGICTDYDNPDIFGDELVDKPPASYPHAEAWQAQDADAKAICRQCPVMRECGDYAIATDQHGGIWGGLTPEDRGFSSPRSRALKRVA